MYPGRCNHGRLCLLHRHDHHISDTVPSEIPVHHPVYFHDGMPGTHSLQPDHHAYRKHLSHDLCMLRIGILPHVGHLRVFLHFSVFYPVIYIIVLESIQLSGLVTMHINDWANWQYMHWFVISMLMVVWICVMCLTRTIRLGKKIPLYGIDWIGLLLWTVMLFAIVFICIYGDFTTGWTACRFAPAL